MGVLVKGIEEKKEFLIIMAPTNVIWDTHANSYLFIGNKFTKKNDICCYGTFISVLRIFA